MGFPGTLTLAVRYTLTQVHGNPALTLQYTATTDKPTVVNFTNHAYFNLADDPNTPVLNDVARIDADSYTPFDDRLIPTGVIAPVAGTPLDFRTSHPIGDKIPPRGYDNSFVLRAPSLKSPVAEVDDPASGRTDAGFHHSTWLAVLRTVLRSASGCSNSCASSCRRTALSAPSPAVCLLPGDTALS